MMIQIVALPIVGFLIGLFIIALGGGVMGAAESQVAGCRTERTIHPSATLANHQGCGLRHVRRGSVGTGRD